MKQVKLLHFKDDTICLQLSRDIWKVRPVVQMPRFTYNKI